MLEFKFADFLNPHINFIGGNGTPDSSRFSMSGQTSNQLPQAYIRNGGSSDTPGILKNCCICKQEKVKSHVFHLVNLLNIFSIGVRNGNVSLAAPKQIGQHSNERELKKDKDLR